MYTDNFNFYGWKVKKTCVKVIWTATKSGRNNITADSAEELLKKLDKENDH